MKLLRALILISAIVALGPHAVPAQQGWLRIDVPINEAIGDVFALNIDTVYITSDNHFLRTTNGGGTWEEIAAPMQVSGHVWFTDDTTGFFAGLTDAIFKTTNSGTVWRKIKGLGQSIPIVEMQFVGRDTGWILSTRTSIARTTDGGESWTDNQKAEVSHFSFATPLFGYGISSPGIVDSIDRSTDGGKFWQRYETSRPVGQAYFFAFSPDTLVAHTSGNSFARSIDSGFTWSVYSMLDQETEVAAFAPDHRNGWAMWNHIVHTTDAGETWELQDNPASSIGGIYDIAAVNAAVAYAVGNKGVVLKTTNGGRLWVDISPGKRGTLKANCYPSPARSETLVTYTLDAPERLSIEVVDAEGETVRRLTPAGVESYGLHNERLDLTGLPNGAYTVRITTEHSIGIAKVTVVR